MSLIKTMTIDDFYTNNMAMNIANTIGTLDFQNCEYGSEIPNFNMIPDDADKLFSKVLNFNVSVSKESGIFRRPKMFIHFESFDSPDDWLFVSALETSTFNIFEHQSGVKTARQGYQFNYTNLFEWDLKVNYILEPGQGVFFRPWLFHSFDQGLVQVFKMKEQQNAIGI